MTRQLTDLELLAKYWISKYASVIKQEPDMDHPPLIAVVGAAADAMGTADMFGDTEYDNMAFLAGYLGYPCDAAYVATVWESPGLVIEHPDGPVAEIGRTVLSWAHCIPTRETKVLALVWRDGWWDPYDLTAQYTGGNSEFTAIEYAAHDFEKFPPHPDDQRHRAVARDMVKRDNGTGFQAEVLQPGSLMARARNWTGVL